MLARLTIEDFRPLEGSAFTIDDLALELRLERARAVMESERARLARQAFSLFFRGPVDPILPQAIYAVRHPAFPEELGIFLVPVGRNAQGVEYEAVFT